MREGQGDGGRLATVVVRYALAVLASAICLTSRAGPPYVSDDPEPVEAGHWEVYSFVSGTRLDGSSVGQAGLDINYGASEDLQLTAVVPVDYATQGGLDTGPGDVELAAKYRFLHQSDDSALPDVAIFPRLFVPTASGPASAPGASLLLPVWLEKDSGAWSWFGGGGIQFNRGANQHNFILSAIALQRKINDQLSLGAEILHQSRTADQAIAYTAANLGITFQMTAHVAWLAAVGPGLQHAAQQGRTNFYTALDFTW